jgi:hypothetical protein
MPEHDFESLLKKLEPKEKESLFEENPLMATGLLMRVTGRALGQLRGEDIDPGLNAHIKAVQAARNARMTITEQAEGATKLVDHLQKFVDPAKHLDALNDFANTASEKEIPMIRQAALALQNPKAIADIQAGAGVIGKLEEWKALGDVLDDPKALKGLGLQDADIKKIEDIVGRFGTEGGLTQLAQMANQLPEDNELFISDLELQQLTTNSDVAAEANQIFGAQPASAFAAGETARAQEKAKAEFKKEEIPASALLDERGQLKPTALNQVNKSLATIIGGKGITFGPTGEMQIVDPNVGLQLGRMAGRAASLIEGGVSLQDAVNQSAEAEGFDVSGAKKAEQELSGQRTEQAVSLVRERLNAVEDLQNEDVQGAIQLLRDQGEDAAADAIEEEFGGTLKTLGRKLF